MLFGGPRRRAGPGQGMGSAQALAKGTQFLFLGLNAVEESRDVANHAEAHVFMFAKVCELAEAGDAGRIKVDVAFRRLEGLHEMTAEELADFRSYVADFRRELGV